MTKLGLSKQEEAAFKAAINERNAAFENDDIAWAASAIPGSASPEVVETAFHKARYECRAVSDTKRLESQKWLADRNFGRIIPGEPIKVGDPLPI